MIETRLVVSTSNRNSINHVELPNYSSDHGRSPAFAEFVVISLNDGSLIGEGSERFLARAVLSDNHRPAMHPGRKPGTVWIGGYYRLGTVD